MAETFKEQFFPNANIHIIPETAHCPFDEDPAAFSAALLPWIDRLDAAKARGDAAATVSSEPDMHHSL
jgi:hypothetical protein